MHNQPTQARNPEELTGLFVRYARQRDAAGIASLYSEDAVMAFPPGRLTRGRDAILDLWQNLFGSPAADSMDFEPEAIVPTVVGEGIALTATIAADGTGARAQVVQRQQDGTWLRILDQPEFVPANQDAEWLSAQ